MAQKLLKEVKINGVDVSSKLLHFKNPNSWGDAISSIDMQFARSINDLITLEPSLSLTVKRGVNSVSEEFVFNGIITSRDLMGATVRVKGRSRLLEAMKASLTKSFDNGIDPEAGVFSEIFKTLVNDNTPLTADNTSVVSTGTINIIEKFISRGDTVYDRMNELRKYVNYFIRYNNDTDLVEFKPKGTTTFGTTLTVGTNVTNIPVWKTNTDELINKVRIDGTPQVDNRTETFSGTGSQTTFTLSDIPLDTEVTLLGVLQTRGVTGSSSTFDYTVNREQKQVIFVVAPPSAVDNVVIKYGTRIPVVAIRSDSASITEFGGPDKTPAFKSFEMPDIKTVEDASEKARDILTKYSSGFTSTRLRVKDIRTIEPGMLVNIVDNKTVPNQNKTLFVTKVTKEWPNKNDLIEVGDKVWLLEDWQTDINKNIKDILKHLTENEDILTLFFELKRIIPFKRRSMVMFKRVVETESDVFILGHPRLGILGVNKLGDAGFGSLVRTIVGQGDDEYREMFYDDYFIDTTVSTATLDTTNRKITF